MNVKNSPEFNNILNECLDRILINGQDLESCLRLYPDQAVELAPLLKTAIGIERVAGRCTPSPVFKARARYEFMSALKESKHKKGFFGWRLNWATGLASALMFLFVSGGGVAVAASGSMPDSPLYGVKLATEELWLNFSFGEEGKINAMNQIADRRVAEIIYLADTDQVNLLRQTNDKLNSALSVMASLVGLENSVMSAANPQDRDDTALTAPVTAPPNKNLGLTENSGGSANTTQNGIILSAIANQNALNLALERASDDVREDMAWVVANAIAAYQRILNAMYIP
ncbi:DUF5667 domain-containing protein [Dehalococcoides mccartyi]|jgi:hypothetical protein|uniref:DUF5667 domain-containing protein n=1 Tax=Dehalococcoides mccartyi TaxID=61435 RepID=UPI00006BEEC5|nr:DUF5667 domain-containing protein [Dehalococcoides mccartyi]AQX73600.1 hypothetical protein B1775_05480 [Dehalococcoides mccartyi]AQX75017.1 hypothetical protein B1776_05595 [Dehalococcoides mccartyi]AQY73592.1 hypothetical protein B1772_05900 [Dehalococcoides mccartyi]BEL01276.1 hypothetical protein DMOBY_11290 [Dehalococcoides mccartyi]